MSRIVEILVQKPSGSLAEFAAEASQAIGIPLVFDGDDNFENHDGERLIYAFENDSEDDLGIPFSKYKFAIAVRTKPAKLQDEIVGRLFENMKSKTPYPMLVVEEAEKILARRD